MIREVNLIEYLPPVVQDYREIKEIMKVENPEFQLVSDEKEVLLSNQFIESCDLHGIEKFEKLLKITPLVDDTLQSRILRVLSRWNDITPYTYKTFLKKMVVICEGLNFTINKNFIDYKMEIITHLELPGQVDELQYTLGYIMPDNLVLVSKNEIYCESRGISYLVAGIADCEMFELTDSYKGDFTLQGNHYVGTCYTDTIEVSFSDNFNETYKVDEIDKFGATVSYASIEGIT